MEDIIGKLRETFKEEVYELLAELEASLLELEKTPQDQELIARSFRAMHTIKGSGATCEFHDVASFTHDIETALDLVRKGKMAASKELIDLTLAARDHIKAMLDAYYYGGTVDATKARSILISLRKLVPSLDEKNAPAASLHEDAESSKGSAEKNVTYRIRFRPNQNIFVLGIDPLLMLEELRQLGSCRVVAQTDDIPPLADNNPELCYTYWDIILTTDRGVNAIQDVFIFVKDDCELKIEVIDEDGVLDDEVSYKKLGDILLERGDLTSPDLQSVLKAKKRFGEILVENGLVAGNKIESALAEQQAVREAREKRQEADMTSSIRVSTEKLDTLVNLVGELVTVQARLSQTAFTRQIPEFVSIAEEIERLTTNLRDNTMNIRMLPIGTTFSKFKRLVRNLSQELSKEIELTTEGAETEMDKTVIERLSDPLVHLIRNSIDHGIEKPGVRESLGKPRQGTLHLSASHSGPSVVIRIRDDGKGLDTAAIRSKAIERKLLSAEAELSEQELFSLIFAPGFSTAQEITSVSGRGVGMDVVKKTIDSLRGTIDVSSERGVGTTITLNLPLTLAIIDGFLTRIGAENFIFPLTMVEECVELTRKDIESAHGRHVANVRGQIVPYVRLREQFRIGGTGPDIEQIVITRVENQRVGFVVDTIIGEHQTVLKSLGKFYQDVEGVSGATILGNGTVALILDIPNLVRLAEQQENLLARGGDVS